MHKDITKGIGFQRFVYGVCYWLIGPFVRLAMRFRNKRCKVKSKTFLALGNHTQNLDPALMVIGMRRHMRFVANASLTKGAAGFLLNPLFGIIPREKGAKGDAVIELIEKNLRAGISVGMFPDSNKSWDGETEFISPRTARLAKESGAGLVTYRFTGGYLMHPRWAKYKRKGPMYGELMNEYTAEQLDAMTVEEVYDAISKDLAVNAYEEQARRGDMYPGKDLAEGLEYAAYLCPHCHRFGTIKTSGDIISCSCGLSARYLPTGWFEGLANFSFKNFAEWNKYQKRWMTENSASMRLEVDKPIAADKDFELVLVENGVSTLLSDHASIEVYGDRIQLYYTYDNQGDKPSSKLNAYTYAIQEITGFGTFLSRNMYFNVGTTRYQLKSHHPVSTLKYYALWRALSGRSYL